MAQNTPKVKQLYKNTMVQNHRYIIATGLPQQISGEQGWRSRGLETSSSHIKKGNN
ncbi:hypothetical protein [Pectobacterium sp. B2J-2]|uniref:hypothetical protein n=1 Tax=Pectobacterium sp. B2J-2 TaxID=3385372 RepID=UPI0038FCA30A